MYYLVPLFFCADSFLVRFFHTRYMYTVFLSLCRVPIIFLHGASLGDPVTSAFNDSIVSLAISGPSILANVSGTCSIVSPFLITLLLRFSSVYYLARDPFQDFTKIRGLKVEMVTFNRRAHLISQSTKPFSSLRARSIECNQVKLSILIECFVFWMFSRSGMAFIQNKNDQEKVIHAWV